MVGLVMVAASLLAVMSSAHDELRGREALESSLLQLLGLPRRPRSPSRRRPPVIPPEMVALYKEQTGMDIDTAALPLPGRFARSANTVRSYQHSGEHSKIHVNYQLFSTPSVVNQKKLFDEDFFLLIDKFMLTSIDKNGKTENPSSVFMFKKSIVRLIFFIISSKTTFLKNVFWVLATRQFFS